VAQAQPAAPPPGRLWRVGILFQADTGRGGPYFEAILQGFRDLGYVEGRDLTIEWRSAAGNLTRLTHLAQELVRLPVDVIMTPAPGIDAAMAATTTIPIVMLSSNDPVEQKQVQSAARPGGNVTGMTIAFDLDRVAKQLQLLKEASPKVSRVGILTTVSGFQGPRERDLRVAAGRLVDRFLRASRCRSPA
jgi:putative ABC transport system substrate-binding protein